MEDLFPFSSPFNPASNGLCYLSYKHFKKCLFWKLCQYAVFLNIQHWFLSSALAEVLGVSSIGRAFASRLREVSVPLSSALMGHIWNSKSGSLQYKRHGHKGESPAKGHKDDSGLGASVKQGEVTAGAGEEKARGDLPNVYKYLMWGSTEDGSRLFSVMSSDRIRGNGHKPKCMKFHLKISKNFSTVRLLNPGGSCIERLWTLHPWRWSKPDWSQPQAACCS